MTPQWVWDYFIHQVLSKTKELVASKEIKKKKKWKKKKKENKTQKCLEEQGLVNGGGRRIRKGNAGEICSQYTVYMCDADKLRREATPKNKTEYYWPSMGFPDTGKTCFLEMIQCQLGIKWVWGACRSELGKECG